MGADLYECMQALFSGDNGIRRQRIRHFGSRGMQEKAVFAPMLIAVV